MTNLLLALPRQALLAFVLDLFFAKALDACYTAVISIILCETAKVLTSLQLLQTHQLWQVIKALVGMAGRGFR